MAFEVGGVGVTQGQNINFSAPGVSSMQTETQRVATYIQSWRDTCESKQGWTLPSRWKGKGVHQPTDRQHHDSGGTGDTPKKRGNELDR
jgi:hypothetical protein